VNSVKLSLKGRGNGDFVVLNFFIHETGEFIEVKGRWIGDAREKVEMFRDEYPAYPLEVIDGLEYKQYMKDFSDIVVQ